MTFYKRIITLLVIVVSFVILEAVFKHVGVLNVLFVLAYLLATYLLDTKCEDNILLATLVLIVAVILKFLELETIASILGDLVFVILIFASFQTAKINS